MFRETGLVPVLAVAGILAACAQPVKVTTPAAGIETRLDDAMRRASMASAQVAGLEIAAAGMTGQHPADPDDSELPPELRQRVSVDWAGPAAPLVQAVADQIGYGFAVTGPEPAAPVMLTLHRRDEQAWRVLRDAGIALKSSSEIVVNVPSRIIELRWPELDR